MNVASELPRETATRADMTTAQRASRLRALAGGLPVLAPLVLFGQIAFLGLRPAICESARLADARVALEQRFREDVSQHDELVQALRARCDPMYLERQRRWLRIAPPPR